MKMCITFTIGPPTWWVAATGVRAGVIPPVAQTNSPGVCLDPPPLIAAPKLARCTVPVCSTREPLQGLPAPILASL